MTMQIYRVVFLLSVFSFPVMAQEPVIDPVEESTPNVTDAHPMSFWMEKKLDYSKQILEALTSGRYEDVEKNAEKMRVLGRIEGFVRGRSEAYALQLQSFDLATREILRNARSENIEGATLAFHQLTTSCVTCHQTLRSDEQ